MEVDNDGINPCIETSGPDKIHGRFRLEFLCRVPVSTYIIYIYILCIYIIYA